MGIRVERWSGTEAPDALSLRRRMEAEGYSVFQWSDPPCRVYGAHAHLEDQSHCIISGALALYVDGEEYTLHAGDRDFHPANTVHSARIVSREPVVYLIGVKD